MEEVTCPWKCVVLKWSNLSNGEDEKTAPLQCFSRQNSIELQKKSCKPHRWSDKKNITSTPIPNFGEVYRGAGNMVLIRVPSPRKQIKLLQRQMRVITEGGSKTVRLMKKGWRGEWKKNSSPPCPRRRPPSAGEDEGQDRDDGIEKNYNEALPVLIIYIEIHSSPFVLPAQRTVYLLSPLPFFFWFFVQIFSRLPIFLEFIAILVFSFDSATPHYCFLLFTTQLVRIRLMLSRELKSCEAAINGS